jgi:hypothetical protein
MTHALPGNGHSRARDVAIASASAALAMGTTAAGAYILVNRDKHTTAGEGDEQPAEARRD